MFGLQPLHILFIIVIALLIFGPARFSSIGRSFRKAISEARNAAKDESSDSKTAAKNAPVKKS